jgi:membrane fusion protein, heavy metal efflux system
MKVKILYLLTTFFLLSACKDNSFKDLDGDDETGASPAQLVLRTNMVSLSRAQIKNIGLRLGSTKMAAMSEEIKVNGIVDVPPSNLASISAPMPGYVKMVDLVPGSPVKKGQTICILEHPDVVTLQQDFLENSSKLVFLKQDLERQAELNREEVGALKKLQAARAEYEITDARVHALRARLKMIGIKPESIKENELSGRYNVLAPFNGFIKAVHINLGKYAGPNDVLFEIINKDHLHLELKVFEKDIPQIKIGQKIRFTLSNDPNKEYGAEVYLIGSTFEADSRAVNIHAHLQPERNDLLPGSYVNASILAGQASEVTLPEKAVIMNNNRFYIFIQEHISFKKIEIKAGHVENGLISVSIPDKYALSKHIVINGAYYLESILTNTTEED